MPPPVPAQAQNHASASAPAADRSSAPNPAHQGFGGRKRRKLGLSVLVVEDDPDDLDLILGVLRPHLAVADHHSASDGEEGLAAIELGEYVPDLILLDLNMPRMGGLELLRKVRAIGKHARTPVIVLTTSGRMDDVRGALQAGASGYIIKPDRAKDLEERLDAVIHGVMRDQLFAQRTGRDAAAR
jgi:CheY-like chemotaxis protein